MKKKSTFEKLTPFVLATCMLAFVAGCGSDDDDSSDNGSSSEQQPENQQEGQFKVVLTPVNPSVVGDATGTGDFNILSDNFGAQVNVDTAPNSPHPQNILIGTRCPAAGDDGNADGIIDVVEAYAASGKIIVPLDSDLATQLGGGFDMSGASYDYNESTSYQTMLTDLQVPDTDATDSIAKLSPGEDLLLEGKVVIVHGVTPETTLPSTVQGDMGATAQQTLPILCGVITRSEDGGTTGDTGTTTGDTGTTTGDTGTTTGDTGTTTGTTGTTGTTTGR